MKRAPLIVILVLIASLSTFAELTSPARATIFKSHEPIHIDGNGNFTRSNGVTGGSGTPSDPYVIEGWEINTTGHNGIEIYNSAVNFIVRNIDIQSNFLGILLQNVSSATLESITITDSETAIELSNSDGLILSGNRLLNNQNGIFATIGSTNVTISDNTVFSNTDYGMFLFGTMRVTVYHNNFVNNTFQARDYGTDDSWNASYHVGGNYWSNYNGTDHCSGPNQDVCPDPDRIGDIPYKYSGVVDYYPLIKPYDTGPPSWPKGSNLTAIVVGPTSIALAWTLATDDTMVISYRILLGEAVVAVVPWSVSTYSITGLQPNTTYAVHLQAKDLADIWSTDGLSATFTTSAIPQHNPQHNPAFWQQNWFLSVLLGSAIGFAAILSVVFYLRGRKS